VINTNLIPILHCFQDYWSNFRY